MSAGLLESARTLLAGVVELGRVRVELVGTELREELARLATTVLGGLVVLILAALGLGFAAIAVVLAVGEEHRLLAVASIAALFLMLALALAGLLARFAGARARPFDATLTELERDYKAIKQ